MIFGNYILGWLWIVFGLSALSILVLMYRMVFKNFDGKKEYDKEKMLTIVVIFIVSVVLIYAIR